jgi:UPF0755 protein
VNLKGIRKSAMPILISILFVFSIGLLYFHRSNRSFNSSEVYFIVKNEMDLDTLLPQLKERGLVNSGARLKLYYRFFGRKGTVKPGNYIVKPRTSYKNLLSILQSGESHFAIVTIPEGFSLNQIQRKLKDNNLGGAGSLLTEKLSAIDSTTPASPGGDVLFELEGFLFPDTYYIPYDSNLQSIARTMHNRFKAIFTKDYISRAEELGLSINEVITIASLIEKEAMVHDERSKIAGVIYNRLKIDMLLQIDAAVIYANTDGERHLDKVLKSHLQVNSPYNTYLYKGLPPGPIAAPGKASIEAALYPESHDYLYYVSSGERHVFSKTYEEHRQNVIRYIK